FVINCIMDERYSNHNLHIFNRWGQSVFATNNYNNDWRGQSQQGTELPEGAYYYVFEWVDDDGTITVIKGDITLLR
ncbi:MAG: gliding motility-associated C-terminal domain-containing protein, partial [Saprospiraceae bacterium]|nr:gliding motility-associated C-terminal domain-containing protein [Saprospiraceae bacterium]